MPRFRLPPPHKALRCRDINRPSVLQRLRQTVGSLLGRPRRHHLLRRLPTHSVGAEVGVFKGDFTREILRIVQPRELHLIDAWWTLYGERYPDWGAYTAFGEFRTRDAYEEARRVTEEHAKGCACHFHVGDDTEFLQAFPDSYFDWIYLDTSHQYEHTRRELSTISRILKPTALLMGDDWIPDPTHVNHGVYRAVNEFIASSGWSLIAVDTFGQWCIQRGRQSVSTPLGTGYAVTSGLLGNRADANAKGTA